MITTVRPMSVDHARALAMAYELHRLLGELYDCGENGPGSCFEDAWNRMDDVIEILEPPELAGRLDGVVRTLGEQPIESSLRGKGVRR